jgi:hypothetical protein
MAAKVSNKTIKQGGMKLVAAEALKAADADVAKDRMMMYNVQDPDGIMDKAPEGRNKFGQHIVTNMTLAEAITATEKYVRGSTFDKRQGVFDTRVKPLDKIRVWDVTDYAISKGKMSKNSQLDNYMRNKIDILRRSNVRDIGKEVHNAPFDKINIAVDKELKAHGQRLRELELTLWQMEKGLEIAKEHLLGAKVVFAEFCARFGKTLASSFIATVLNADIIIVTTYVKTVFTSFEEDVQSFEQFAHIEHINMADADYQERVLAARDAGKKIMVYLGMNPGPKRQERVDFIAGVNGSKYLIVDEADFGIHQKGQAQPLIDKLEDWDNVLLMTGTNADRAASLWPIDVIVNTTYPELIMYRREAEELSA